jgi:hypothetical protein
MYPHITQFETHDRTLEQGLELARANRDRGPRRTRGWRRIPLASLAPRWLTQVPKHSTDAKETS